MFDTIHIYVPEMRQIIKISEGTGDNLLDEDIEAGYVDYIYYDTYVVDSDIREHDGGMVMLKELFREKFSCTADSIPSVLDMAYGSTELEYIIL
jgi:hypothetical protein